MLDKKEIIMGNIEPDLKREAEEVLRDLGIPVSLLITTLYKRIVSDKRVPFHISKSVFNNDEDINQDELEEDIKMSLWEYEHGLFMPIEEAFSALEKHKEDEAV